jgi:hypothetical protein
MKRRLVVDVAEQILLKAGRPLHYKEITKMLLNQRDLSEKAAYKTVRSMLAKSPKFKRVDVGVFSLAIWKQYPAIRFAKDIAYDVLKEKGQPMSTEDLSFEILLERKFISKPKVLVRNIIVSDARFYYDSILGQVGLAEWKKMNS